MNFSLDNDTIAAIATPAGTGGIAVIRVSGPDSRRIVGEAWKGGDIQNAKSHSVHYGRYISTSGEVIDDCVATVFIAPKSFTAEDTVELAIHGSSWIQREILQDLIRRGARSAGPGEFTQRAFINGKIDLAQAEGVADLIASSSKAAHDMALSQTSGHFSREFDGLRQQLIEFASLLELELDFSEEDVEFAERNKLLNLCKEIIRKVDSYASSYSRGVALKEGVPVVIAGLPNAGKSSILNMLLSDDKAIVTDIPGTTRDIIEGAVEYDGILYRFIDTAGIRETDDVVESIGVERALAALQKAFIVIWVIDGAGDIELQKKEIKRFKEKYKEKPLIVLNNKVDLISCRCENDGMIHFSTKTGEGFEALLSLLKEITLGGEKIENEILVSNTRHYESLLRASDSLNRVRKGLEQGISGDFIAGDLREAIAHLATITGSITTDNLLASIFSRFCIGK